MAIVPAADSLKKDIDHKKGIELRTLFLRELRLSNQEKDQSRCFTDQKRLNIINEKQEQ